MPVIGFEAGMIERVHVGREAVGLVLVGALASAYLYLSLRPWNLADAFFVGAPLGSDFVNFWLGARLALEGRTALLFDLNGYNDLLAALFGHENSRMVFSYPPTTLVLLAPFGVLPHAWALAAWTGLNLAGLFAAARALGAGRGLALAAALSPAAVVAAIFGHFGGMLALAATLSLRLADRKPVLAGLLLALCGAKPQFGLALGAVLLLAGRWRCIVFAAGFGTVLLAVSAAWLGLEPWRDFVTWTLPLHRRMLDDYASGFLKHTVTLYTALRGLDAPAGLAWAVQLTFGAVVLVGAAVALRRRGPTPAVIALVLLAAVLGPAYGSLYDLAIAAPAVAVALLGQAERADGSPGALAAVLWLAPVAALPLGRMGWPVAAPLLAVACLALLAGLLRGRPRTSDRNALFTLSALYG